MCGQILHSGCPIQFFESEDTTLVCEKDQFAPSPVKGWGFMLVLQQQADWRHLSIYLTAAPFVALTKNR